MRFADLGSCRYHLKQLKGNLRSCIARPAQLHHIRHTWTELCLCWCAVLGMFPTGAPVKAEGQFQ
jgi:hypothetical protein